MKNGYDRIKADQGIATAQLALLQGKGNATFARDALDLATEILDLPTLDEQQQAKLQAALRQVHSLVADFT